CSSSHQAFLYSCNHCPHAIRVRFPDTPTPHALPRKNKTQVRPYRRSLARLPADQLLKVPCYPVRRRHSPSVRKKFSTAPLTSSGWLTLAACVPSGTTWKLTW